MNWQEVDSIFTFLENSLVGIHGFVDHELVWLNATKRDLQYPERYKFWRAYDYLSEGPILDTDWHYASVLHNGETLYVSQANGHAYGTSRELNYSTNPSDITYSLPSIRFSNVEPRGVALYEIQLPLIEGIGLQYAIEAMTMSASDQDELFEWSSRLVHLYQERKNNLRRLNLSKVGNFPQAAMISLASSLRIFTSQGIENLYIPLTMPIRHATNPPEEIDFFMNQTINLDLKSSEIIDGVTISENTDALGYITQHLEPDLTSTHKLLQTIFQK